MSRTSFLVFFLIFTLTFPPSALAQEAAPQQSPGTPTGPVRRLQAGGIHILVLEGQGVVNSLSNRTAISPVVQVLNSADQPVQGAIVTFEVAPAGPGGSFGNAPIATVRTDSNGQATAAFTPNSQAGPFSIKVTATMAGQTSTTSIRQINDSHVAEAGLAPPPKRWYKSPKWWAVIGATAGGGIAAATILAKKANTPTITISPGSPGIGGPR
ncbi:MAG TPA: hypothetical protein VFQ91_12135 [Bryobacteraceae bacterium]|nr:hypothetical protein [Bryobacteraceae bacterium]